MISKDIDCPTCGAKAGNPCCKIGTKNNVIHLHLDRCLISLRLAARLGINKLRKLEWINKNDYIEIDIVDKKLGPWVHLYSDSNIDISGKNPVDMIIGLHPLLPSRCIDDSIFIPIEL